MDTPSTRRKFHQTVDVSSIQPRSVVAGELIFAEGAAGDGLYLADNLRVEIWRQRPDGHQTLGVIGPGAIFGEMALIDGAPRTANATAMEDGLLLFVPEGIFRLKLGLADPFLAEVFRLLVGNIRSINDSADQARSAAADQNPLTRLPGNRAIEADVLKSLSAIDGPVSLAYFDFDYFKPFNDGFGFAIGDEAIALFADLMRQVGSRQGTFVGHVGGDDFYVSMREPPDSAETVVRWLLERFSTEVRRFYDAATLQRGSYASKDRDGNLRDFPLLRVSAVQVDLPAGRPLHGPEVVNTALAAGKKYSKAAADGFYRRGMG